MDQQQQQPQDITVYTTPFDASYNDQYLFSSDNNMFPNTIIKKEEQDFALVGNGIQQEDLLLTSGYYPNNNNNNQTNLMSFESSDKSNLSSPDMMAYQYVGTTTGESCDLSFLSASSPSHYSNASYSPVESIQNFDFYPTAVNTTTATTTNNNPFMQQQGSDTTIFHSSNVSSTTSCDGSSICDNETTSSASSSPLVLSYPSIGTSSIEDSSTSCYFSTLRSSSPATTVTTPSCSSSLSSITSNTSNTKSEEEQETTPAQPTENRPYPCHLCRRAFARKHDLQRHVRVHTGEKPYVCPCCKKAFARTDALKRHLRMEDDCRDSQQVQAMKETGRRRYRNL